MNGHYLGDFLSAMAACDAEGSYEDLRRLASALSEPNVAAKWEVGLCGADPSVLRLALRECADIKAARAALSKILGLPASRFAGEPAQSCAWITVHWDANKKTFRSVDVCGRGSRRDRLKSRRFSAKAFEEPVASALANFAGLAPIKAVQSLEGGGWSLVLEKPLPWPLFLRCDISGAFSARAAQLTLMLRDVRIVALDFDDDALWARIVG